MREAGCCLHDCLPLYDFHASAGPGVAPHHRSHQAPTVLHTGNTY
jgi:hypothetical protein